MDARIITAACLMGLAAGWGLAVPVRAGDHHDPVPVPPRLEIEVLDPRADPLGNPAVETVQAANGRVYVDIPPSVLVHRYYYTGDRSFQYSFLPGGPSVLVLNHPGTGERLYLEVTLPPGAPRVTYNRHYIEYNYGTQAVSVVFGIHGRPKINYRQGKSTSTIVHEKTEHVARSTGRLLKRTKLPEYGHQAGAFARGAVTRTADVVGGVTQAAVAPVVGILQATPLASAASASVEQQSVSRRNSLIPRAEAQALRDDATIPTIR